MPPSTIVSILLGGFVFGFGGANLSKAAESNLLEIYPPNMHLAGPGHRHSILVLGKYPGKPTVSLVSKATFLVEPPALGTVSKTGEFEAKNTGKGIVRIGIEGKESIVPLEIGNTPLGDKVSFTNDILPILTKTGCNSGSCHGALAGKGSLKLSLRGYNPEADHHVLTGQLGGRRIDKENPRNSLLLRKPLGDIPHSGGKKWDREAPFAHLVLRWITQDAQPAKESDISIKSLAFYPPALTGSPNASEPIGLLIQATYSDGITADVTSRAKFSSASEDVCGIDNNGLVRVVGTGESAISAWYNNLVATARVISPRPMLATKPAPGKVSNWIDLEIQSKLDALGIPVSGECTDAVFLRRSTLDLCGVLPTLKDIETFQAMDPANRRSTWIDTLLARSEYADYWTHKYCDQFLVTTKKITQSAVWAFARTLRREVANNRPWDQTCRDILTATGSNLDQGGVNFFLMHRDPGELNEAISVTFMGTSIACAKCHNHPLEKWTQDQYWSMANLFGRVTFKNGARDDEVILIDAPAGDVNHIRRGIPMAPRPLDGPIVGENRREDFARWLTSPENSWFAKAQVNRLWKGLMGRGLVENDDDLRATNPASHPELLNRLAKEFVLSGHNNKAILRLIAQSSAYQRSSTPIGGNETDDRFYSRHFLKRLPAEVLLDAYSQVTSVPTKFDAITPGGGNGSQPYGGYPVGTRAIQLPDSAVVSTFLDSFGRPERNQACSCERGLETTIGQALHVANGSTLNDKLKNKEGIITHLSSDKSPPELAMEKLWLGALSRKPSPSELANSLPILKASWGGTPDQRREAVEDLFWAVLTSREFLFNY